MNEILDKVKTAIAYIFVIAWTICGFIKHMFNDSDYED